MVALAVAGAAAGLLVRAYAGDNGDGGTGNASALPADLRDFARGWPLDGCTRDGTPGDKQDERWRCPVDGSTSLYLIRYQPGGHRDTIRERNDRMKPLAGKIRLERGPASAPGGAKGLYREYEVDIGSAGRPDWNDQIWFDNYPVQSPPLALILRTARTPDTAQALAHLRELWAKAGYSRPA
ncbi:hypothetical protein ACQP2F_22435 [Actinoplanes sp. CA-030573]|uniref:hypothetical protein n=1 Tax=Actinoplanes sp. CA-030573 TaxID=3239898 RepID=UPI003D8EE71A